MKNFVLAFRVWLALLFALAVPGVASAQVVTQQPTFISPTVPVDFGNGPMEMRVAQGNALIATSSGTGVGSTSGSSTTLTLTATPTTPPCVGCIISGTGITSGTTVAAFNGTTTITLSAAMTVAASTPLAWGAACPTTSGAVMPVQAGVTPDLPLYTQARVCGWAQNGPGAQVLVFPIGAH